MPELPEVETIVRELRESALIGKRIIKSHVFWHRSIATPSVKEFCAYLQGQIIKDIYRRGKFIVFTLNESSLLIHLRMTGKLLFQRPKGTSTSHERVSLDLDDGRTLHYDDQRKFGKWYLLKNPEEKFQTLGLEPLSENFTLEIFHHLLAKSNQQIKPFLLNQKHIVGLGNIYVDEALWAAQIHPMRKACTLTNKEIIALHSAIPQVLQKGINSNGTTLGSLQSNYYSVSGRRGDHQTLLNVFRRNGFACPRCQTQIIKITLAQRGTHLCPCCQKNP